MKILSTISTALIMALSFSQAQAGTWYSYETNIASSDITQNEFAVTFLLSNTGTLMQDQLLSTGCMPRGTLLSTEGGGLTIKARAITRPGNILIYRFNICNDPLLSAPSPLLMNYAGVQGTNARSSLAVSLAVYQYQNDQISKRNIPKVSFVTPSGNLVPLNVYCYNSSPKRCHFMDSGTPVFEAGTYEVRVENNTSSRFQLFIDGIQSYANKAE